MFLSPVPPEKEKAVIGIVLLTIAFLSGSSSFLSVFVDTIITGLFVSLIIAITIFVIIDQKIVNYSQSSAEVIQAHNIEVEYDEDNYVSCSCCDDTFVSETVA